MTERRKLGRGLESLLSQKAIDSLESSNQLATVHIDDIDFNEQQPRQRIGNLESLATSIKEHGVLQPILLTPRASRYLLIAGERRLRAAKAAGLREIPARVIHTENSREILELSLIENIQREDLDPIELANAYVQLMEMHGLSQQELADAIGLDRSTIANTTRLLKLSSAVQQLIIDGKLSEGHARTLVGLSESEQLIQAQAIINQGLSVRQAEASTKKKATSEIRPIKPENPEIKALADALMQRFATKIEIQSPDSKGKGKIILEYYSIDDLNRIIELLS